MFFVQCQGSSSTLVTVMLQDCWLPGDSSPGAEGLAATQKMKTLTQRSTKRPRPSKAQIKNDNYNVYIWTLVKAMMLPSQIRHYR